MMTSTMSTTSPTTASTSSSTSNPTPSMFLRQLQEQQQQERKSPLPSSTQSLSTAPIIHATEAFSQTIALNNAGALLMERGDYVASIKALTSSFLAFKKSYIHHKPLLISLRTSIQESERIKKTQCNNTSSSSSQQLSSSSSMSPSHTLPPTFEEFIFNVDELFSWRQRRAEDVADAVVDGDDDTFRKLSNMNNTFSDHDDHSLCHSYRNNNNSVINQDDDDDGTGDAAATTTTHANAESAGTSVTATGSLTVATDDDDDDEIDERDVASVYSNPIHLPPDFPITRESCGFLSTTITLNLALANHLYGLELQEQPNIPPSTVLDHLTSAGRYYEYTIRLERARQQEEQRRMNQAAAVAAAQSTHSLLPPLFISPFALLVILNNLGQLHMSLSNKDRSQKCYRQLQSTLMFLLVHSSKHTTSLTSNSRDLAVFMENATLGLQSMTSRPLAAAA